MPRNFPFPSSPPSLPSSVPHLPAHNHRSILLRQIHALNSIENPKAVFEKGTWENKLLGSMLFAYGKELALKCPYAEESLEHLEDASKPMTEEGLRHLRNVRKYLNRNADHFLKNDHFSRFTQLNKNNFSDVLKGLSPISYMKKLIRFGFGKYAPHFFKRGLPRLGASRRR